MNSDAISNQRQPLSQTERKSTATENQTTQTQDKTKLNGDNVIEAYYGKPAQKRPAPTAITSAKYHDQAAWNIFNQQRTNMPEITFIARSTEKPDEEMDMHPNINTENIARTTESPIDELENRPNVNNTNIARTTEEIELDNKVG
jgi:hypothetical protein